LLTERMGGTGRRLGRWLVSAGVPTVKIGAGRPIVPYLAAYAVTMLGDRFAEMALPLAVLIATGSPAAAGAVAASVQVPGLVLALFLGNWTDRGSRRSMLVWADAVRAVAFGAFALLAAGSGRGLWPFLLIGAVVGGGNVLFGIASQAALPQLVQGPGLGRANAVLEAADGVSLLVGPAIAGVTVARLGAAWGLAVNAVSFVISGLLLRLFLPRLGPLEPATPAAGQEPEAGGGRRALRRLRRQLLEPLGMVLANRFQLVLQLALMALSAHGAALVLAVLVLGRDELHLSIVRIGLVLSAAGVGGLVVSLLAARFSAPLDRVNTVVLSLLLSGAAAVALAVAQSFWWALVANGVLDGFITAGFITTATVRQARTPNAIMGRVGAASALANNLARVVGVAGAGVLLAACGGRVALVADAALLGLAGLGLLAGGRGLAYEEQSEKAWHRQLRARTSGSPMIWRRVTNRRRRCR
jgi:MFS family permease